MNERKARIQELRTKAEGIRQKLDLMFAEIAKLELEEKREEYPCSCVKLNEDIEVYDMAEQERRGRTGLGLGMVAQTLSCRKDCEQCGGTGQPKKHNHFGEIFTPDTCPACRFMQRNID